MAEQTHDGELARLTRACLEDAREWGLARVREQGLPTSVMRERTVVVEHGQGSWGTATETVQASSIVLWEVASAIRDRDDHLAYGIFREPMLPLAEMVDRVSDLGVVPGDVPNAGAGWPVAER